MAVRDTNVDKAAAAAGTTRLPGQDNPTLDAVLPPGDLRNRQELERAAEAGTTLNDKWAAQVDKYQADYDKLHARIDKLEADMLAKQNTAEDRADTADDTAADPQHWPAHDLDQGLVEKVAKAAGLLPNQVFNLVERGEGWRVYTNDSRKLDVKSKDVK